MANWYTAIEAWTHMLTNNGIHLGATIASDNRIPSPTTLSLIERGHQLDYLSYTIGGDSHSFDITLANGRYLHFEVEENVEFPSGGNINITMKGCEADGSIYEYHGDGEITNITQGIYYNLPTMPIPGVTTPSLDYLWLAGSGMELAIGERIINTDNGEFRNLGMSINCVKAETGTVYPHIGIYDFALTTPPYTIASFNVPADLNEDNAMSNAIVDFLSGATYEDEDEDYGDGDGGSSPSGGSGGSYTSVNNVVQFPSLPGLSAINTGFIALYAPTSAQLNDIANWLWSPDFFDNIIKNYQDPFNNILGLWISPVTPPTTVNELRVGNVSSGISANKVTTQYGKHNCGVVSVKKYYNSFADYEQYRQFKMFIPYYGIVDISTDDFIGGSLEVEYNVDYLTGTATVCVQSNRSGKPHIINSYTCNIYSAIPFSGVNMMSYYQQLVKGIGEIGGGIVSGNIGGVVSGSLDLISNKPNYAGSSSMGATGGLLGIQYPYLIECRSIRDMPTDYAYNEGITSNKKATMSSLSGYTEFSAIHVKIPHASESINNKIEEILKGGVII